jgi:hypothetical protein
MLCMRCQGKWKGKRASRRKEENANAMRTMQCVGVLYLTVARRTDDAMILQHGEASKETANNDSKTAALAEI